ncbi:MAG TPA: HEAT repeat domain-containing protein [Polyangiaceae bacterium]|nr:HEAT repeat domain-containing protein [Polyangiaceae bacterium]
MNWGLPPLPPNFGAALRDVHAKRPESRMAAAERLGRAEGDEREGAVGGLRTLASDLHPGVRATALAALGLLGGELELPVVLAGFTDPAAEVREFAALAAAQIGGHGAVTALRTALTNEAPEVRFQAAAGLADLVPDEAAGDLLPLLADPDPEVRSLVISALAILAEPHLVGHLAGALDDDHPNVRLEAALALGHFGDPRAEAPLLRALHNRMRVAEVARALSELGCRKGNDEIAEIAAAWLTPPHLRAELGAALVVLDDDRGAPLLRRVLSGLRSDARSYAVELAREVEADAVVPDLVRLTKRPRGVDYFTLIEALATFSSRSPDASAALSQLGQRTDAVGEAARRASANTLADPVTITKERARVP